MEGARRHGASAVRRRRPRRRARPGRGAAGLRRPGADRARGAPGRRRRGVRRARARARAPDVGPRPRGRGRPRLPAHARGRARRLRARPDDRARVHAVPSGRAARSPTRAISTCPRWSPPRAGRRVPASRSAWDSPRSCSSRRRRSPWPRCSSPSAGDPRRFRPSRSRSWWCPSRTRRPPSGRAVPRPRGCAATPRCGSWPSLRCGAPGSSSRPRRWRSPASRWRARWRCRARRRSPGALALPWGGDAAEPSPVVRALSRVAHGAWIAILAALPAIVLAGPVTSPAAAAGLALRVVVVLVAFLVARAAVRRFVLPAPEAA